MRFTVLIRVGSADCRNIVGSSADCKDVSQTLSACRASGGCRRVRIGDGKVDEVQSTNKENI